jgi:hypothetical protein
MAKRWHAVHRIRLKAKPREPGGAEEKSLLKTKTVILLFFI